MKDLFIIAATAALGLAATVTATIMIPTVTEALAILS